MFHFATKSAMKIDPPASTADADAAATSSINSSNSNDPTASDATMQWEMPEHLFTSEKLSYDNVQEPTAVTTKEEPAQLVDPIATAAAETETCNVFCPTDTKGVAVIESDPTQSPANSSLASSPSDDLSFHAQDALSLSDEQDDLMLLDNDNAPDLFSPPGTPLRVSNKRARLEAQTVCSDNEDKNEPTVEWLPDTTVTSETDLGNNEAAVEHAFLEQPPTPTPPPIFTTGATDPAIAPATVADTCQALQEQGGNFPVPVNAQQPPSTQDKNTNIWQQNGWFLLATALAMTAVMAIAFTNKKTNMPTVPVVPTRHMRVVGPSVPKDAVAKTFFTKEKSVGEDFVLDVDAATFASATAARMVESLLAARFSEAPAVAPKEPVIETPIKASLVDRLFVTAQSIQDTVQYIIMKGMVALLVMMSVWGASNRAASATVQKQDGSIYTGTKSIKTESSSGNEMKNLTKYWVLKRFLSEHKRVNNLAGRKCRSPPKSGRNALQYLDSYEVLTVQHLKMISRGFGIKTSGNKADLIVSVAKEYRQVAAGFKNDQIKALLATKRLSPLGKKTEMVDRLVQAGF